MRALLAMGLSVLFAAAASAQQSERFGPYEVHYSVLTTTFLQPEIAARYDIIRARDRAMINIAVREHLSDGSTVARSAKTKGRAWDLMQRTEILQLREVREGSAIYYIDTFKFLNEEIQHFEIHILPENAQRSFTLKFLQKLYTDD